MGIVEYAALAVIVYLVVNVILKVTLVIGYGWFLHKMFMKDEAEDRSTPFVQPEFDDIPF
jgi:predicted Na+-dependent transporter